MIDSTAKELRREYLKQWRQKNKEKIKEYNEAYWMRKAEVQKNAETESNRH